MRVDGKLPCCAAVSPRYGFLNKLQIPTNQSHTYMKLVPPWIACSFSTRIDWGLYAQPYGACLGMQVAPSKLKAAINETVSKEFWRPELAC